MHRMHTVDNQQIQVAKMKLLHIGYLLVYIITGSSFSLLVKKSSQDNGGKQPYEPVAVTFSVELFKLATSLAIIVFVNNREQSAQSKLENLLSKWHTARQFAIPAVLYCIFNALAFYNLNLVSPPTYRLLINLKVLWSGLMLQFFIGTRLTAKKWAGLVILVIACGVEQWDSFDVNTGLIAVLLIMFQAFCSSFAGVYFQLLLQIRPQETAAPAQPELGLWEKNFYMYCWTIFFNTAYLAFFNPSVLLNPGAALSTFDANVIPIILMNGVGGVSTSLILRDMDVIVKEYANFAEMCVVVLCSFMFLGTPLKISLFLAVLMVTVSLYLYNVPDAKPVEQSVVMSELDNMDKEEPRPLLSQDDTSREEKV